MDAPERPPGRATLRILGVAIDRVTMAQALDRAEALMGGSRPAQLLTPNVDHLMRCRRDPLLRAAYEAGELVVADGMPLVWAARYLGTPLPERVAGSDLTPLLCGRAAEGGYPVFLMGGLPGAAEGAARVLRARHPDLLLAGVECPPIGFERDAALERALLDRIRTSRPALLVVALGSPKQEVWIHRHKERLGVPLSIGVGATLDFMAGLVRRAPRLFQKTGLEWFWRLLTEPRRLWRRYLVDDLPFFWHVLREKRAGRR